MRARSAGYGATVEKTADFPAAYAARDRIGQARDHPPQVDPGSDYAGDRRSPPSARRRSRIRGGERSHERLSTAATHHSGCGDLDDRSCCTRPRRRGRARTGVFPSANKDATALDGYLLRPAGAGPFPAIVALHGCSGLWGRQDGELSKRHADWGERFVQAGYLVLFPDSFNPRGVRSVCSSTARVVRLAGRADDAIGAAQWLAEQSFVDKTRIAALGWSNGGSTVLRLVAHRHAKPMFAAAVAFYPGCSVLFTRNRWQPRFPR